jgi:hypothetical protein
MQLILILLTPLNIWHIKFLRKLSTEVSSFLILGIRTIFVCVASLISVQSN